MRHAYTWRAILAVVLASTAGDVLLSRAMKIYGRFAKSGTVFDNARTLDEGISPPPPFYSYADICAATAEQSSIAAQMEDDFK